MGRLFAGRAEKSKRESVANRANDANQRSNDQPDSQASQHSQGGARHIRAPSPIRDIRGIRSGKEAEKVPSLQRSGGQVTVIRKRLLALAEDAVIDAGFVDSMTFDELAACADKSDTTLIELLRTRVRDRTPLSADPFGDEAMGLPVTLAWMPARVTPTEPGSYVVRLRGARFPMCMGWVNEAQGWRRGAMRVQVDAWLGPLP